MPSSVTLGQPIIVNTPGRPIKGREQHAALVTEIGAIEEIAQAGFPDMTEATSELVSAIVFPADGQSFTLRDIEREDLLHRVGSLARAPSWQPISPGPEPSEQGLDGQAALLAAKPVTGDPQPPNRGAKMTTSVLVHVTGPAQRTVKIGDQDAVAVSQSDEPTAFEIESAEAVTIELGAEEPLPAEADTDKTPAPSDPGEEGQLEGQGTGEGAE